MQAIPRYTGAVPILLINGCCDRMTNVFDRITVWAEMRNNINKYDIDRDTQQIYEIQLLIHSIYGTIYAIHLFPSPGIEHFA